jgi:uncharacterized membrane protein
MVSGGIFSNENKLYTATMVICNNRPCYCDVFLFMVILSDTRRMVASNFMLNYSKVKHRERVHKMKAK